MKNQSISLVMCILILSVLSLLFIVNVAAGNDQQEPVFTRWMDPDGFPKPIYSAPLIE